MIDLKTQLIRALDERLIPKFVSSGFALIPLSVDERKSREIRSSFPMGRLRRTADDGSFEIVEIQFDKYGDAKFRLNFGSIPPEGIDHPVKHVEQSEADIAYLPYSAELYSFPFFMKWFSVSRSDGDASEKVRKVVDRVVGYVPEVEAWFKNGKVGPHVRFVGRRPS